MNRYVWPPGAIAGVFPDYPRQLCETQAPSASSFLMHLGLPPPPRTSGTNIRNASSPHWRGWLKPESRCLVLFISFAEYAPEPNPETKKRTWLGSRSMTTDR
jgi:putative SOS response-associated peptidase YedK